MTTKVPGSFSVTTMTNPNVGDTLTKPNGERWQVIALIGPARDGSGTIVTLERVELPWYVGDLDIGRSGRMRNAGSSLEGPLTVNTQTPQIQTTPTAADLAALIDLAKAHSIPAWMDEE